MALPHQTFRYADCCLRAPDLHVQVRMLPRAAGESSLGARANAIPYVRAPKFYFGLSLVFASVAFAGFTPTYLAQVASDEFTAPALVHLHGLLFFGWTLLLVAQSRLAQVSLQTHRAFGLAGISLATAMVLSAFAIIARSLALGVDNGNEAVRALSIVPVFAISTFAICFALAIANLRRADNHKRFMVLATVALLPAAFARMLFVLFAPEGAVRPDIAAPVPDLQLALNLIIVPALLANSLLIAPIVYDWRTRGRPHRIYVIGGLCIVGSQALRPLIATTSAWHSATDALLAFTR